MPELVIDGVHYEYRNEDANLLATALSHGLDLPYFCWHPVLNSVGACRQCAVKVFADENDESGKLVMSCMTAPKPGMRVSIADKEAEEFRAAVIEWLMVNHPHDCPICDEGGECHLQDMTVMTGHTYRRYRHRKRTYQNQNLGPFINHEMNRCIQCYRCVRFYRDYAGGTDLDVFGWHDHVYFGRFEDGTLENEFSGNLVEICPTGVFTDKTLKRHYTRKWDLATAPSVCTHCGLGCNTIPGEREGRLRRVYARYSSDVNGYFLCDRGRFGYEYTNSERRIRYPRLGTQGGVPGDVAAVSETQQSEELALEQAHELIAGRRVIGIGSPRASVESNFALHSLVGADGFFHGVPGLELRLVQRIRMILDTGIGTSIQETGRSDCVLVLGEDLHSSAPILALSVMQAAGVAPRRDARTRIVGGVPEWDDAALREAVQGSQGPLFVATPAPTKLDELAQKSIRRGPLGLVRLARAVLHAIDASRPAPRELPEAERAEAAEIAAALRASNRPVIACGTSCGSEALIDAAAETVFALRRAGVEARACFAVPAANSMMQAFLPGGSLDDAVAAIDAGEVDTLVVVENDLSRSMTQAEFARITSRVKLLVIDHIENPTTEAASVLFPAATVFEADGSYINHEGRIQRAVQVYFPEGKIRESWRWLGTLEARRKSVGTNPWMIIDVLQNALAKAVPSLAALREVVPPVDHENARARIPRLSHRASGRTALYAARDIHEPPPPVDEDSPLSFSMEGRQGIPPAPLTPRYWAPGWNSVQALNKFQTEVAGILKGGSSGRLLFDTTRPATDGPALPAGQGAETHTRPSPASGEFALIASHHLFGGEELSLFTAGVRDLSPAPYLGLGPQDAAGLGCSPGDVVRVTIGERSLDLPLRIVKGLAGGTALYPTGAPGAEYLALPATCSIAKIPSEPPAGEADDSPGGAG